MAVTCLSYTENLISFSFLCHRFHQDDMTHIAYYTLQAMGAFIIVLNLQIEEHPMAINEHYWDRHRHQTPVAMTCTLCRILTVFM
jgi:hypothetical protein